MDSNRQLAHETNTQGRQKKNLHFPLKYPVGIIHIYSKRAPICKQWYSKIQETPGQLVPREIFERLDGQQMRHQLSEFFALITNHLTLFPLCSPQLSGTPTEQGILQRAMLIISPSDKGLPHCLICSCCERICTISCFPEKASYSRTSTRRESAATQWTKAWMKCLTKEFIHMF